MQSRGDGLRWKWSDVRLRWDGGKGGGLSDNNITRGLGLGFSIKLLSREN
jgi:hypothetical protein